MHRGLAGAALFAAVAAGCSGAGSDGGRDADTSISPGPPKSAEQCLREGDQSGQQYPLRIAVPGGEATMPKDDVRLHVCFERQYGNAPAHLTFRLNDVAGSVTPQDVRVDSPEGAAHMIEVTASLTGGSGGLEATIDFSPPGETSRTTQSDSVRFVVDGDVVYVTEK